MAEIVTEMFGSHQVYAMEFVLKNESGFRPDAINASSGACGLAQALPCSKMGCELDFAGADCQLKWMANYIKARYQDPIGAKAFWERNHWY